jgi:hypothetical protein
VYSILIAVLSTAAVMGCLSSCRLLYDKGAFSVKKSCAYYEAVHILSVNMVALTIIMEQRIMIFSQLNTELLS